MLYYTDLEKKVFELTHCGQINKLVIISGYVGSEPIRQLSNLPNGIHKTVIYGMYGSDNISAPLHQTLVDIQKNADNIEILYSTVPIHSKIYMAFSGNSVVKILIGSANFSINGLRNDYKEVLADANKSSFHNYVIYYNYVKEHSVSCIDSGIKVRKIARIPRTSLKVQPLITNNICRASLLDKNGLVPEKSGLNWGLSTGHVSEGDAYIPIRMNYIRIFPKMFPPKKYVDGIENNNATGKKNRENDEVELIWDDGVVMIGLLEGQAYNKDDGMIYPKQLSSSPQKSIMGRYLRNRLGVSLTHVITKTDLLQYGRSHIDITLISDGVYYMDFSVNKNR